MYVCLLATANLASLPLVASARCSEQNAFCCPLVAAAMFVVVTRHALMVHVRAISYIKMEPAKKVARPSCIQARLPFISGRALSTLLELAKHEDLPQATSRASLREARDKEVRIETPYGALHQHICIEGEGGKQIDIEVQHPLSMLWHICRSCQGFANLLHPLLSSPENGPGKPLNIILYMDEVMPGNPLAVTTERKIWAVYWSILELGSAALSQEDNHVGGC